MRKEAQRAIFAYLVFAFVVVLAFNACHGTDAVNPPEGPNTSYPCGVWGVSCGNGACCPWAHVCGVDGDPWRRCEVGYCCADVEPFPRWVAANVDGGAELPKAKLRQRKP